MRASHTAACSSRSARCLSRDDIEAAIISRSSSSCQEQRAPRGEVKDIGVAAKM